MRRRRAVKRKILPDTRYNSRQVAKFINMIMREGKKSVAERIVYRSFELLREKTKKDNTLEVFQKAVDNVRPVLEVKSKRVGGATYQVPVDVKRERGITLALGWIRNFARQRKGKPMEECLAEELFDAYKGIDLSV